MSQRSQHRIPCARTCQTLEQMIRRWPGSSTIKWRQPPGLKLARLYVVMPEERERERPMREEALGILAQLRGAGRLFRTTCHSG
jgi:hypothetical protein